MHSQIRPRNPSRKNVSAGAGNTLLPMMRRRIRWQWIALITALPLLVGAQDSATEHASDSLFGLDRVMEVTLTIEPEEWAKLQPPEGLSMDVGEAFGELIGDAMKGGHMRAEGATRPGLAGYLGVNHQYGKATFEIEGKQVSPIGLRYKGNGTFLEYKEGRIEQRISFKIDFNEFQEDLSFRGLGKLNLNNNITDPSYLREALSYELFREAGIPCSRVSFARVNLRIPGLMDRQPHGLYSVVEQVDTRFLKHRYGSAKGLLLKPSTFGSFRYLGESWEPYEIGFVPKTTPTEAQKERVIAFARLVSKTADEDFAAELENYLDVDQFLRFLAVNTLLCNLDSFLGNTQNHYVYLEPESDRFQFLPWDMDHSFGSFPLKGSPESRRALNIDHPGGRDHKLIERVLAIPEHKEHYHAILKEYLGTLFEVEKLHRQIDAAAQTVRPLVAINGPKATERFDAILADEPVWWEKHPLKYFVSERHASVSDQLSGMAEGADLEGANLDFKAWIALFITGAVVILMHFAGWIWGMVAGFRSGPLWGFLNLCFYPICPLIYGFAIRRDLGRRAALWAFFWTLALVGVGLWASAMPGK